MFDDRDDFEYIWKEKRNGGTTLYKEDYPRQAYLLSLMGANDAQLAEFFGIKLPTLYLWKKKHPDFEHSIKEAKFVADTKVAASLYQRAIGYDFKEIHEMKGKDRNGEEYKYTKTITKHLPPDVKAATIWLSNRQPEHWTNAKRKMESKTIKFDINQNIDLSRLSEEEKRLVKSIAIKSVSNSSIEDIMPHEDDE
ncbi:MAG: helix-turn-helix domain-containing protein [Bacteroidota bacterium]